jgi:hypothetical protein
VPSRLNAKHSSRRGPSARNARVREAWEAGPTGDGNGRRLLARIDARHRNQLEIASLPVVQDLGTRDHAAPEITPRVFDRLGRLSRREPFDASSVRSR